MTDRRRITRRDFINGMALGVAAGSSLSPLELMARAARAGDPYPPALTGMRGSHPGSFEVAHALAWGGRRWPRPEARTDDVYDLVVVGAGISGLAAAFLYRQRASAGKRVLILDNHDDFGGHARRNEFTVDGRQLIAYGGSQSIDSPGRYSQAAKRLLADLAIDTDRFYEWFDRGWHARHGLVRGIYFSAAAWGEDRVVPNVLPYYGLPPEADLAAAIREYPLSATARDSLLSLLASARNLLPGRSPGQQARILRRTSYSDFLRRYAGVPEEVVELLRDTVLGLWGVGWDALSALEAWRMAMPGTGGLDPGEPDGGAAGPDEPYIFHFPDGNAAIARALVQRLVPAAVPATTIEELVTARIDYGRLDRPDADVRIRLHSTAVDVRNANGGTAEVTYVRRGRAERVCGRHVVLACYNCMIPYLCPELPAAQKEAIEYATKVPLVYLGIAVRNWHAFERLGFYDFYVPRAELMCNFGMDFPVSIGRYAFTRNPGEPTVIHGLFAPTLPDRGLSAREQHDAGRRRLLEMSFDEFEDAIMRQMDGALSKGGFDAERDIAGITVNRWPHGYAYEYNDYSDPPHWGRDEGPHVAGRARIGRISIANSDASAYAYVDGAIDAADRAVAEQLGLA
ncbi:MAG TPA: NAD(P)-binding protein [Woeseiaceae bacterium]|nr:NAD(P)-binding protein [Woeseiaceae bacterium]